MPRKGFSGKAVKPCPVHYTPMLDGVICPACQRLGGPHSGKPQ